jgi:uncharacterized protein YrrD
LGPPIAYLVIRPGTPVYGPDGVPAGTVEHVLADDRSDVFHGLIANTQPAAHHYVFVDADQIAELHERGVVLSVERDQLYELTEQPGERGGDIQAGKLHARLQEARDWVGSRPQPLW